MKLIPTARAHFYHAPDTDGGGGGGGSAVADPPNQQQQQQAPAAQDPFSDIDLEMLDETTRAQVEKAKQSFATVANQQQQLEQQVRSAQQQAQAFQARYDQLVHQRGANQQQQQQQQPQTFEEELLDSYVREHNLNPAEAKAASKMMGSIFAKFEKRMEGRMAQQFGPLAQQSASQGARSAFEEARQQDQLGIFRNPEISQQVWDRLQEISQSGNAEALNAEFVQNLGSIFAMRAMQQGKFSPMGTQQPQQQQMQPSFPMFPNPNQQQQPQPQQQQMQTRWTFPGSGANPLPTMNGNGNGHANLPPMDADMRAAMGAVHSRWPIKPKGY